MTRSWHARRWLERRAMLAICASALVSACGVGGEGTGSPQPGVATGRVESLGRVGVAGETFDERDATLLFEIDPRAAQPRPVGDLRLGMVARVQASQDQAPRIVVAAEVVGPVQQVDAAAHRIVVAGQTVLTDAVAADPTVLDGLRSIDALRIGDRVEVHGARDAAGNVRASRIARSAPGSSDVRVAGNAFAIDAAARSLRIGALFVDTAAAERPSGDAAPQPGDRVVAYGRAFDGRGRLVALALQVARPLAEGTSASLAGPIAHWQPASSRFELRGVVVDGSALAAADRSGLAEGSLARVTGRMVQGVLQAATLTVRNDSEPLQASITANVSDFVQGRRFALRGTAIDAGSAAFEALTPANLANGVPVQSSGSVTATGIRAQRVVGVAPVAGAGYVQAGTIVRLDAASRTLRLDGLTTPLQLASIVRYTGGREANLADGVAIEASGSLVGAVFIVEAVQFGGAGANIELAGIAGGAEADPAGGGGGFGVGEIDVRWTAATRFIGPTNSAADLIDGVIVRITGTSDGTTLTASAVDARPSQPGVVFLRGTVDRYVSLVEMSVDGARVDASHAVFDPPELRGALVGAFVDVEGRMEDSVLVATRVSDP